MDSQHTFVVSSLFRPLYHQRHLRFLIVVSNLTSESTDCFVFSISDPVHPLTPYPTVQPNTTSEITRNTRIRVSFTPAHSLFRILPSLCFSLYLLIDRFFFPFFSFVQAHHRDNEHSGKDIKGGKSIELTLFYTAEKREEKDSMSETPVESSDDVSIRSEWRRFSLF